MLGKVDDLPIRLLLTKGSAYYLDILCFSESTVLQLKENMR